MSELFIQENEYEKSIPYIVYMKENSKIDSYHKRFCGFLIRANETHFQFRINGNSMIVIIPIKDIDYMAPSGMHTKLYTKHI